MKKRGIAGTDPTDATSRFHAWIERGDGTNTLLQKWASAPDRSDRVLSSLEMNGDWLEVASGIAPSGTEGSFEIDPSAGDRKFFRIAVTR
jgi:hypothetical protein